MLGTDVVPRTLRPRCGLQPCMQASSGRRSACMCGAEMLACTPPRSASPRAAAAAKEKRECRRGWIGCGVRVLARVCVEIDVSGRLGDVWARRGADVSVCRCSLTLARCAGPWTTTSRHSSPCSACMASRRCFCPRTTR
eukprot:1057895-Rhodomonas_salina.1